MAQHKRDALLTTVFVGSAVLAVLLQGAPAWPASGGVGGRASDGTLGNGRPGADAPADSADPDGNLGRSGAGGGGNGGGPGLAGGAGGSGYTYPDGSGPLVASPGGAGGTAGTNGSRNGGDGGDAPDFSTSGAGGGGGGASGNGVAGQAQIDNAGTLTGGDGGRGGRATNYDAAQPGSVQGGGGGGAGGEGAIVTGAGSINRAGGLLQGGAGGTGGDGQAAGGGGEGGIGLRNTGAGAFTNAGAILGGGGGAGGGTARADSGLAGNGGAGGIGVFLSGPSAFINAASGSVVGGDGGIGGGLGFPGQAPRTVLGASGEGGAGLSGPAGASLSNAGTITGGTGGAGAMGAPGFVEFLGPSGASAATGGTGGTGGAGARGGTGVQLSAPSGFANTGTLAGGAGGTGGTGGVASGLSEGPPGPPDASGGAGGTGGTGGTGLRVLGGTALGNAGTILGGNGGQGGAGGLAGFTAESRGGAGGQGGAGGLGAQIAGVDGFTNSGLVAGGQGGAGGGFGAAGGLGASGATGIDGIGGTGGTGLLLDGATRILNAEAGRIAGGTGGTGAAGGIGVLAPAGGLLINAGTITGGAGGLGATGVGAGLALGAGSGGTAIVGAGLAIVNSGTIAVGTGATGPAATETGRAVTFTGGLNSLTLTSTAQIEGAVVAFSAADRLVLGGTTDGTFSAAAIGPQYQNFGVFQKVDAGVWTLTGTTPAVTPWQVLGGTLAIGADANLGAPSGGLLLDGGTLQATAALSTGRTITLGAASGAIRTEAGIAMVAGGPLVGEGGLTKSGAGTLTLTGASTYAGATLVSAGTLQAGAVDTLAPRSAFTVAGGAALDLAGFNQTIGSLAGAGSVTLGAGTLTAGGNGGSTAFSGTLSGAGGLTKAGAGTLTLSGANTYSGGTALNGGTVLVASDAGLGAAAGALSFGGGTLATGADFVTGRAVTLGPSGGTLAPGGGTRLTLTGLVGGAGGLTVGGTGRVVLTGANSYGGGTLVDAGATLQVGDGGTAGAIPGPIVTNGTLTFNRSDRLDVTGVISGSGTLNQSGTGLTNLTGRNGPGAQFTGTAAVNAGTLAINGTFGDTAGNGATVTVNAGGTLHGSGTIAGSVIVNGGTVSAGNSPGTLTVAGNYTLNPGSTALFEFGSPGVVGGASNDLITVGGNLGLGGTLRLVSATDATVAPVSGAYRLFNYGGALSGAFDSVTAPGAGTSALVYTNIPAQVNVLLANGGQSVQFWDGADTTGAAAGGQGGTGTWSAGGTNWTRLPGGQINDIWRSGVGLFGGSAGTVTVTGAQNIQGLQFTVDGTRLGGAGTLNLTGDPFTTPGQSFVSVDAGVSTTIATALTGQTPEIGLRKLGAGTLTLSGASTYTGATTVTAGTLALAAGGSLTSSVTTGLGGTFTNAGTVGGGLANAGAASNDGTITGPVSNSGSFVNRGTAGALTSTGSVTNTGTLNGAVTINGGSLALGAGSLVDGPLSNGATVTAQGRITGPVTNAAGASFTLSGPLAGLTALTNAGSVSLAGNDLGIGSLTGNGGVIQNAAATAATLTLGAGSTAGTVLQDGAGGGALALAKVGTGTLSLTGASPYGGGTRVAGGTLALGGPGAAGTGALALESGTGLAFLGSGYTVANAIRLVGPASATIDSGPGTVALSGPISGPGALEKAGLGTLVVSGTGSYTGATAVTAGILQVDGALSGASALTVGPGAGLTGTGRVGALTVQSGGFVAPGNAANPTGTLTAAGPVVLGAGSTLATTLSLSAASQLVTPSTATIASGSILQITPSTLAYVTPVRLPILVASTGLTGQFTTIRFTAPVRGLQPSVGYEADNAYIQFGETAPSGPTEPGRDLTSAIASAQGLARDRIGAFVTQRVLGSVLTGFNQQINCGDCLSGFGMAGSYSVGAQGRKALTEELIAIGGFAYTGYDSGRVRVSGAPIFAGLLRYDPATLGSARPFVDVGGLFAPSQNTTYARGYTFGTMTGQGIGRLSSLGGSVFGRVGYVARLSPQDEVAAAVEYSRGWQYAGAYNEGLLAPNPYALVNRGGTDLINIAKLGGQVTHLFGTAIEAQLNLGVAHGFGLKSGLNGTVAGVPFLTPIKDLTWAEYGVRLSYRVRQDLALDAFILGTLGPQPVGDTIHGGASVRYAF